MKYFYKNLAYEKCYDENSFVAGLMDYFEWSDEKYWLLESDLIDIYKKYHKKELPIRIMRGIVWLLNTPLYHFGPFKVKTCERSFKKKSNYLISPLRPSISDRVNRLRSLILTVSLDDDKFFYTNHFSDIIDIMISSLITNRLSNLPFIRMSNMCNFCK